MTVSSVLSRYKHNYSFLEGLKMSLFTLAQANRALEETWKERFGRIMPTVERTVKHYFLTRMHGRLNSDAWEEFHANCLANCWEHFRELCRTGRDSKVYASVLAKYACKQTRSGRIVGTSLNVLEVLSDYSKLNQGHTVYSIDSLLDSDTLETFAPYVIDQTADPAHVAQMRLDFRAWLKSLTAQTYRIASMLATGETTRNVAEHFHLTDGRISQIRNELRESWRKFIGDDSVRFVL